MAAKQPPPLMKKHSQTDLVSRLKTRKILGVGGEDDDGEVHRSKISQVLGNEIKFAVREPLGLRVWQFVSAVLFSSIAIMVSPCATPGLRPPPLPRHPCCRSPRWPSCRGPICPGSLAASVSCSPEIHPHLCPALKHPRSRGPWSRLLVPGSPDPLSWLGGAGAVSVLTLDCCWGKEEMSRANFSSDSLTLGLLPAVRRPSPFLTGSTMQSLMQPM
ncbi:tumor protein p53-inducible protein 11 isoform X1 [Sus scrofa]|uniref:tumor protein p53-inducible protein 11 isoform X1 n=1 Tax=Sus scrofa TaxID=9823 RepID=UPI0006B19C4D|nr:tumor protein p53-inducible protein 11 isoform X1 [Sus scrofa]